MKNGISDFYLLKNEIEFLQFGVNAIRHNINYVLKNDKRPSILHIIFIMYDVISVKSQNLRLL